MKYLLGLLAAACSCVAAAYTQPKFSIDQMELNLGIMYNGSVKTGRYNIKNIGNQPLLIKYVQPSCGCTAVRRPQEWIQPGKSDVIDIEFNSAGFRGKIEKYVHIATNDPGSAELTVKLVAEVREELQPISSMSSIPFGGLLIGKEIQQSMTFKNVTQKVINVNDLSLSSRSISAKTDKMSIPPADSLTVTVTLIPDREGYAFEQIVLRTDSNNQPKIEIKVSYIGIKGQ